MCGRRFTLPPFPPAPSPTRREGEPYGGLQAPPSLWGRGLGRGLIVDLFDVCSTTPRRLLPLILSLILLAACGSNTANTTSTTPTGAVTGLDIGNQAPNFTTQLISGQNVSLESLKGRIVLINFWATWCGPCRAEMPFFQRLADNYDKKDFQVLAIDFLEQPATITKFTDQLGLKFDVGLDQKGEINRAYNVLSYPTSYVIGRDGKILARQSGPFIPPEKLETALKQWIAGS